MRITKVEIKNYRSIESISFNVLDPDITCFIGGNGSGKSNILHAIASVGNDTPYEDSDFYVEVGEDDEIEISVWFQLQKSDNELLEHLGLDNKNVPGFKATKKQSAGNKPVISAELVEYDQKVERILADQVKKLEKFLLNLDITDADSSLVESSSAILCDSSSAVASKISSLEQLQAVVDRHSEKVPQDLLDEDLLSRCAQFQPGDFAYKYLLDELTIEVLALDSYTIDNEALIDDLKDRTKHPFLFDLLSLSGKTALDFAAAEGNKLINLTEDVSHKLTEKMKEAWGSHDLPLVVQKDKKDTSLMFCSRTPHGKAIPLRNTSLGTQWFLRFHTRLTTANRQSKRIIWLFDEPDAGLHAKSQHDLVKLIEEQSRVSQILYCTHQPIMIQWHRLERINVVENMSKDKERKYGKGTKIHRRFWDDNEFDSPLKEVLKLFIGEDILWTKEHVVVEGPSDYFYLVGWTNFFHNKNPDSIIWGRSFSSPNRAFVPAGGITNIPLFLYFLTNKNKSTVNWASVTDSGSDHDDIKDHVSNSKRLKQFKTRVIPIERPEGANIGDEFDIEDLFDRREYFEEFSEYYSAEYNSCKLPKFEDISTQGKITKAIEAKLNELNPSSPREIKIDKPGVAQHIYMKLSIEGKDFSDVAKKNFRSTLNRVNQTFNID